MSGFTDAVIQPPGDPGLHAYPTSRDNMAWAGEILAV